MAFFTSKKSMGQLRALDRRAKSQAKVNLFFNKVAAKKEKLQRQYDQTISQRLTPYAKKAKEYSLTGANYAAAKAEEYANRLNASRVGNVISRGLPSRGPFFSRTPGQPMSATVVQDAKNLTVEYR